jgi:membrane protein implicated in regulation of membrane protease activity
LIEFFDSVDPWIFLIIGVGLIAMDLLFGALFIAVLGGALIVNGVAAAAGAGPEVRLWTMFAFAVVGVPLYKAIFLDELGGSTHEQHFTFGGGETGHVIWVDPDNQAHGRAAIVGRGEWLVRSHTGLPLKCQSQVEVVTRESSVLVVRMKIVETAE